MDAALPTSQGRSFRALLRGEEVEDWPDAAYYRYWEHDDPIHAAPAHYGIRTKDHKLIYYYGAGLGVPGASETVFEPEWELYDLNADPTEVRNVAVVGYEMQERRPRVVAPQGGFDRRPVHLARVVWRVVRVELAEGALENHGRHGIMPR